MNTQETNSGFQVKYTKQSFEEVLQEAYDNLQPDDIIGLLCKSMDYIKSGEHPNKKITSITKSVIETRNISFKQWKAISAYVAGCNRKQEKQNNKTF